MKIKNILFVSLFAGAVLSSCDYTDLSPIDSITDKTYWTTTNDLKLYANGLYGLLASPTATGDNTSDNFVPKDYSGYLFNEYTVPASASSSNGWYWNDIRSCNYFLQRYQTVEGSEAEINKYVAEIRFMRGLLYYSKIKQFGDVPWYDKDLQTSDTEELYKARDSRDFVLGKVFKQSGACSLDDPHPKFLFATIISPDCTFFTKSGSISAIAWLASSCASKELSLAVL